MHCYKMGVLPKYFSNICRYNHEGQGYIQTRQSDLFHIDRCDTLFASRLPIYNFPKLWNEWSHSMQNMELSKSQLKKCLKESFIKQYVCTVKCSNQFCKDCSN